MVRFLDSIDWERRWLAPYRAVAEPIIQAGDWLSALNKAIAATGARNHRGLPIRFVAQSDLPAGTPYEAFISTTGQVPTRENLHDFFNALVWLTFPQTKVQLNALQAAEIAKHGHGGLAPRGWVRDAATIFDENAAIFVARDDRWIEALRAHQWRELLWEQRECFENECDLTLFGHALMEKLVSPYKAITAHTWPLIGGAAYFEMSAAERRAWLDKTIAGQLSSGLKTAQFSPLPVLGVPGWSDGQSETFYADTGVFRPPRVLRN
jgi:hypothetical protein